MYNSQIELTKLPNAKYNLVEVAPGSSPCEKAVELYQQSKIDILRLWLLPVHLAVFFVDYVDTHDNLLTEKRFGIAAGRLKPN